MSSDELDEALFDTMLSGGLDHALLLPPVVQIPLNESKTSIYFTK